MIIRNSTVWPILFLRNVFTALKGTQFYILSVSFDSVVKSRQRAHSRTGSCHSIGIIQLLIIKINVVYVHKTGTVTLIECVWRDVGGQAIPNGFSHLLGSSKTLIRLNDKDNTIKFTVHQVCMTKLCLFVLVIHNTDKYQM